MIAYHSFKKMHGPRSEFSIPGQKSEDQPSRKSSGMRRDIRIYPTGPEPCEKRGAGCQRDEDRAPMPRCLSPGNPADCPARKKPEAGKDRGRGAERAVGP